MEDLLHVLRRYVRAAVEHREVDGAVGSGPGGEQAYAYRALPVHVVERVGEEVGEDLLDLDGIEGDLVARVVGLVGELEVAPADDVGEHLEYLLQELVQVAHRVVHHHLGVLVRTEIKEFRDEALQLAAIALEYVQGHLGALGHLPVGDEVIYGAADERQRRLEFVGYVREEHQFRLRGLLELLGEVQQLLLLRLQRVDLLLDPGILLVQHLHQFVARAVRVR